MITLKKYLTYLIIFAILASYALVPSDVYANSTKLFIEAPSTVKLGEVFTVKVLADTGSGGGNRSRIDLIYNSDSVQGVSTNINSSAFGGNTFLNNKFSTSEGRVTHLAYPIPAPQGRSLLVFSSTFKASKVGSVNFSFSSDSAVNDSVPNKITKNIPIVDVLCPPGQSGTQPNCSSSVNTPPSGPQSQPTNSNPNPVNGSSPKPIPNTPSQPAQIYPGKMIHPSLPSNTLPPQSPAPQSDPSINSPDIVNQQVLDSELGITSLRTATRLNRADLRWEINHPSNSSFKYGKSADKLDQLATVTKDSSREFYTNIINLDPGETYYYTISGSRDGTSETLSQNGTFSTKGFGVEIKTLQQDGSPLTDARISLEGTTGSTSTDAEGVAYIQVKDGSYNITVSKGGHSSTHKINVDKKPINESGDADIQKVVLKTSATTSSGDVVESKNPPSTLAYIVTIAIGLTVMTIAGIIIYVRKRSSENNTDKPSSIVVIEDDWMPPR